MQSLLSKFSFLKMSAEMELYGSPHQDTRISPMAKKLMASAVLPLIRYTANWQFSKERSVPPYLQANNNETPSKSIYPGQNAHAVGFKAIPDGPAALQNEQYEAVASGFKSVAVSVAPQTGYRGYPQRQITWQVKYGTAPSAVAWVLQGAIDDVEEDYVQVDTASGTTEFVETVASNFRFFRLYASAVTGACTAIGKITAL